MRADPHYVRLTVALHEPIDLAKLEPALRAVGEDLYRAKGFALTPKGPVYLDFSAAGLNIETVGPNNTAARAWP